MNLDHKTQDILIKLLRITHSDDQKNIDDAKRDSSQFFENLIRITQAQWLRPAGTERWDLIDSQLLIDRRNDIMSFLAMLGFVNEVKPARREYDCVLIFGASDIHLNNRLHYLKKLWNDGLQYKRVYLLTGDIKINNANHKFETDTELAMETYKEIHANNLKEIEVIPIIAKNKRLRPNTEDTLNAWLDAYDDEKNVLAISSQPFVPYQNGVLKRVLSAFSTETVGDLIEKSTMISVILDSVARYLYELSLSKKEFCSN